MPPVDPNTQAPPTGQPDLDIIAHPVLGPLRFPKDMGPDERNQIIQQHMAEHKAAMPTQPVSGSIAPPLTSHTAATKYGLKEFGGGLYDVGKGIVDTFRPPETTGEKAAGFLGPAAVPAMRTMRGIGELGKQAMQVPGAIRDLAQSPDPIGSLALVAPRAGGQTAGAMIAAKAPDIAEVPRYARATGAGTKAAIMESPLIGKPLKAFADAARESLYPTPAPPPPRVSGPPITGMKGPYIPPEAPAPRPVAPPPVQGMKGPYVPPEPVTAPVNRVAPPPVRGMKAPFTPGAGTPPGAPGATGVTVLPEPRATFPGENPNMMGSVPRNELGTMAVGRKPGAGAQMQQLGEPVLYTPNEAGYPAPRSVTRMPVGEDEFEAARRGGPGRSEEYPVGQNATRQWLDKQAAAKEAAKDRDIKAFSDMQRSGRVGSAEGTLRDNSIMDRLKIEHPEWTDSQRLQKAAEIANPKK